ncbi:hypothetical protein LSCM1_08259 [Leishmania martiniquensis]|uniref:Integral membrane protein n=1 Tax=Leishmania martiniquensis TaxID=1580590 RepID=A0A836HAQ6_9TRYP|nr:hypothetical protein LSCM1_08259 [Leishmania martiniquensis]
MRQSSAKRRGDARCGAGRWIGQPRRSGVTLTTVALILLLYRSSPAVRALNVCADISRCSECVLDQTDGLMPPPLMCGWCESTKTCMEVNRTVMSYYRTTPPAGGAHGDSDAGPGHTPAEIAAFRASFCEDLRERNFNPSCPDMFCAASRTTNNIYICRAPPIIALVLGCILFVLSALSHAWMKTLHQLPWRYEPFLSDILAGRYRPPDSAGDSAQEGGAHDMATVPSIPRPPTGPNECHTGSPFRSHSSETEDFGELEGSSPGEGALSSPVAQQHQQIGSNAPPPRATAAAPPPTALAGTGYCPICKCLHPVRLGPGDVCFWCNVARFVFVPFSLALLSSTIVIVLTFAVSLKPWFSDVYFAEVLMVAYLASGGFVCHVLRHHRRVLLFRAETEAERQVSAEVWPPSCSPLVAARGVPVGTDASVTEGVGKPSPQHSHSVRLQLLNDARRNMASTTYLRLALRLRGRSLLGQIPELKQYRAQIESMHAAPTTLTRVGGILTLCTSMLSAMEAPNAHGRAAEMGIATGTGSMTGAGVSTTGAPPTSRFAEATTCGVATAASSTPMAPMTSAQVDATAALAAAPTASTPSSIAFALSPECMTQRTASLSPCAGAAAAAVGGTSTWGNLEVYRLSPNAQAIAAAGAAAVSTPATMAATSAAAMPVPLATSLPNSVVRQKRGETAHLLTSDLLSPQYRKALKATLFRDEFIVWCSEPQLRSVLMENKWLLLDLLAGLLFGIWMLMLSSVSDNTYAIVKLSGSTAVAACGLVVVLCFALLLAVVIRSCGRLYVLTSERLITVYESVIEPVVTVTDLSSVRFAALYGYRSMWSRKPVVDFSWEVPASERRMPAIKSHKFSGISDLRTFLQYFRLVAPQMPSHLKQISQSTRQDRVEWRMHVILCIGLFITLPIVTVYPHAVPDFLAAYLYVVALLVIISTLLRGLRAQQMTCAPLSIAASWAPDSVRNEMGSGAPPRQPPASVKQTPDACSPHITTPSSMGNTEGSQELGKGSASPTTSPAEPNGRSGSIVVDTAGSGETVIASTVHVCWRAPSPP